MLYLGIEGGATRTVALLSDASGRVVRRLELGPLNLKLAHDRDILATLRRVRQRLPRLPVAALRLSICLAGCRTQEDRARLRALAARVFGPARCFVGNDLDSGLAAALGRDGSGVLMISGTGSCVVGRHGDRLARAGGWGHLLGDHGSGYWIALSNLRWLIARLDRTGRPAVPLQRVLRRLCLNSPEMLVDWMARASKRDVAGLVPELIHANPAILSEAADRFAADGAVVARRLGLKAPLVALSGGVFAHHPKFVGMTARRIRQRLPGARVRLATREPAHGALLLAGGAGEAISNLKSEISNRPPAETEQRNPRTLELHRQSVGRLIDTLLSEEARVIPALRRNRRGIERAVRAIVAGFRHGGRLFYVGAGTSGRLGVLDASECPPTFSTEPGMVQGIIAGGAPALWSSVEGAEDDARAGAEAVRHRGVRRPDVVIGIAASGSTPFVLGALDEARHQRARTFLLCFSPPAQHSSTPALHHSLLFFRTGPEALTGSTRLKAGTATKLVLNLLSTVSMIRLGKVVSNLMVDVRPANAKLRARAVRIVAALRGCDAAEALERLTRAHWDVRRAAG